MMALLEKDIPELVKDAGPIRNIFQVINDQLSPELQSAIIPAVFIEGNQFQVLQAKQRLADRAAQQNIIEQRDASKQEVVELKRLVDILVDAPTHIDQEINRLRIREA